MRARIRAKTINRPRRNIMTQYSLLFVNNSTVEGNVCVYQRDPGQSKDVNLYSLAWFTQGVRPGNQAQFYWEINYSYVWSQTGVLKPGITFLAQGFVKTDPGNEHINSIGFNKNEYGYSFVPTSKTTPEGMMGLYTDASVPNDEASVGVAMSGSGTFAYAAKTNMTYTFQPHPEYWITFGDYHKGQVMDVNIATETAKIAYPKNIYAMTATLNEDNTFTVSQLNSFNAAVLARMKK